MAMSQHFQKLRKGIDWPKKVVSKNPLVAVTRPASRFLSLPTSAFASLSFELAPGSKLTGGSCEGSVSARADFLAGLCVSLRGHAFCRIPSAARVSVAKRKRRRDPETIWL